MPSPNSGTSPKPAVNRRFRATNFVGDTRPDPWWARMHTLAVGAAPERISVARPGSEKPNLPPPWCTVGVVGLSFITIFAGACSREPERSVAAYCQQVKSVQSLDEVLHSGDSGRITTQLEQLRALDKVAPADIEPKLAAMIPFIEDYSRTLATTKDPDSALDAVLARRKDDPSGVANAGIAVATYTFNNCQVTLGSGVPGTGTSLPAPASSTTTSTTAKAPPTTVLVTTGVPTTKPSTTTAAPTTTKVATTTAAPVNPSSTTVKR